MSNRSIHFRRAELGAGTVASCGTVTSSLTADPAEVTCKRCLKTLETGSAETGYLAGSSLNQKESTVSDKKIDLIAQMLAKAEQTTAHEAEALREAAEKLMQKYLIDQAVIDERRAKTGKTSEKIVEKTVSFTGAYRGEMLHLCSNVVRGLGTLRAMQYTGGNNGKTFTFYLVGFESDVAQAELLINSLQIQAAVAVRAWWTENKEDYSWETTYNQEKARRSFVHGFGSGVGTRMVENRRTIIQETSSTGTELVLVARKDKVDEHMSQKKLGKGRARTATGGGFAAVQGYAAGKQANTGEKGVSGTKSISNLLP